MFNFKKIRSVTLPLIKWVNGVEKYFRFDGAAFIGKEVKQTGTKKMEPATLAHVTDLESGEQGQIILATVLRKILDEEYPDNSYVGRSFAITQHRVDGKAYNTYTIEEIEEIVEDEGFAERQKEEKQGKKK